jgi:hypothetical protein
MLARTGFDGNSSDMTDRAGRRRRSSLIGSKERLRHPKQSVISLLFRQIRVVEASEAGEHRRPRLHCAVSD